MPGFRLLSLVRPFLAVLPDVQTSDRRVPFREKVRGQLMPSTMALYAGSAVCTSGISALVCVTLARQLALLIRKVVRVRRLVEEVTGLMTGDIGWCCRRCTPRWRCLCSWCARSCRSTASKLMQVMPKP